MKKQIYGIDFSGARDAGKHIWLCEAIVQSGHLIIRKCFPASRLPGSDFSLNMCLPALRKFLTSNTGAVFGLDFPMGLPAPIISQTTWEEFVRDFHAQFTSPEEFRSFCLSKAGNKEIKRLTDIYQRAPLCPYNIRLFRQTYYGVKDIVAPLLSKDSLRFLPMQHPVTNKPWGLEVCLASTLKSSNLYMPYKGKKPTRAFRRARQKILQKLGAAEKVKLAYASLAELIIRDTRGDVLDSVIAAFAVFRALSKGVENIIVQENTKIEGQILGAWE